MVRAVLGMAALLWATAPAAAQSAATTGPVQAPPTATRAEPRVPEPMPWIGVGLEGRHGALGVPLASIYPDTPAAEAGLRGGDGGDEILAVDGAAVRTNEELIGTVRRYAPGQTIELVLFRDGRRRRVSITLAQKPTRTELAHSQLVGRPLPTLALKPTGDLPPSIADMHGDVVIAVLVGVTCRPCDHTVRALDQLRRERGHRDLRVIGIGNGQSQAMKALAGRLGVGMSFYAELYEASSLAWTDPTVPLVMVIDRAGIVRYAGTIDENVVDVDREARMIVDRASLVTDRVLGRSSRRSRR